MRLPRLRPDFSPLRASHDLRLVVVGALVSSLGTQATLVALPYQLYVQTRSALLVGLLGAVELVPLVAMALLGGAIADRMDRRRLLLLDQFGLVLSAGGLAVVSFIGHPAVATLYLLGGLLAASARFRTWRNQRSSRTSSMPSTCAVRSRSPTGSTS